MKSYVSGDRRRAYLFLTLTTTIWGSLYVVTRIALETVPPLTLLFFRYAIASVALYALARVKGQSICIQPKDRKVFGLIGVLGYFLSVGVQIVGIKYAGASVASLINAMNPIFTTLFAILMLKEKLTLSKAIATVATLAGAYVILGGAHGTGAVWGMGLSVLSVILWSLSSIFVRRVSTTYNSLVITTYAIFLATLCSLPAASIELAVTPHGEIFSTTNILCFLYLGILATALPNLLWNKSLSLIEASTCSLFYPVQPMVSVLLGITALDEKVNFNFSIGAILIVGGIMYALLSERKRPVVAE